MSSTVCPNCGAHLSCSCQLRTSIDGRRCCDKCKNSLNEEIRLAKKGPSKIVNMNRRYIV